MIDNPVFLVGSERSGTTLLRLMLHAHPLVTWSNEFEYAVAKLSDDGDLPELQAYYDWLSTHRIFQMSGMTIDPKLSYPELVNSFLIQRADPDNPPQVVGATVHHHFNRLLSLWPNAKFIYLLRDPRAVSRSCVQMGWHGNVWTGLDRWLEAERLWKQVKPQLHADNRMEIRYRDLIVKNRTVLEQVCEFMGIAYSDRMMNYVQVSDYGLPDPKLVDSWRAKLSQRDVQLIEARLGRDRLRSRGFEPSKFPAIQLSAAQESQLKLQNWWAGISFRIQRYGLGLVVGDMVTRKLGARQLNKSFQLKINQVQLGYLKKSW